ncbi:MAG TPA: DNA-binding response regulator [Cyanobacteria bacterium UBA11162]|nr:DNA-binding response regulator [Cyanobacteria bacterium UBA11162]
MRKILIIEDDQSSSEFLCFLLSQEGYACQVAFDGLTGLEALHRCYPDLVILDLILPGMNGLEVCSKIRSASLEKDPYILCLTAKASVTDRIIGLSTGADLYMTKPFEPNELIVQIRSLFRRYERLKEPDLSFSTAHFDFCLGRKQNWSDARIFMRKVPQRQVEITQEFSGVERALLAFLARNAGLVQSRDEILTAVWSEETDVATRTVDASVSRLRKRLNQVFPEYRNQLIETVELLGYRFVDVVQPNLTPIVSNYSSAKID